VWRGLNELHRSPFEPRNPLTCPEGTLSPSEGERERERGPFIESSVMGRGPITFLDAAVRGDTPARCPNHVSGVRAENDDLLSLPLSSKGGEGNGDATGNQRDAC
jgi:hypothetical protein